MRSWIVEVSASDVKDDVEYFLAKKVGAAGFGSYLFLSELKSGKRAMSFKPGLALRIMGGEELRSVLEKNHDHCAVAIPADADRRWRRRS